jgi:hypothetical protein
LEVDDCVADENDHQQEDRQEDVHRLPIGVNVGGLLGFDRPLGRLVGLCVPRQHTQTVLLDGQTGRRLQQVEGGAAVIALQEPPVATGGLLEAVMLANVQRHLVSHDVFLWKWMIA